MSLIFIIITAALETHVYLKFDEKFVIRFNLFELNETVHGLKTENFNNVLSQAVFGVGAHDFGRLVAHDVPTAQLDALGYETIALEYVHELLVFFFEIFRKLLVTHGQRIEQLFQYNTCSHRSGTLRFCFDEAIFIVFDSIRYLAARVTRDDHQIGQRTQ